MRRFLDAFVLRPVVGHMLLPHLASPQLHVWRCFPVVGHLLLPHLASPQLHFGRCFPGHMLLPFSFMDVAGL